MRTITLEEHFVTDSFLKATGAYSSPANPTMEALRPKLLDLGEGRIQAMDEGDVNLQVMSLAAIGLAKLDAATGTALLHDVNDELAAAIKAHPDRLAGWAALELKDPQAAAKEFEHCVQQHGFVGALVDGTVDGEFLDNPKFAPLWETAVDLGVPVYLHPAPPAEPVKSAYYGGLPEQVSFMLSTAAWGWHSETALHILRLISNGVFDRYPNLQVIIGHMGEMLPMALARTTRALSHAVKLRQPVDAYFQTNLHLTTSGYFTLPPLRCALDVVGIDRMMYSVDYPFSANTLGQQYLRDAAQHLGEADLHKLAHGNAEALLKLEPTA